MVKSMESAKHEICLLVITNNNRISKDIIKNKDSECGNKGVFVSISGNNNGL